MHRALFLEEILHVIFAYCRPERIQASHTAATSDLVALARTCQVFKEPALDALWSELNDITPLLRCLPGVCVLKSSEHGRPTYGFKRWLKETERETINRYTRRVRALTVHVRGVDPESLKDLCLRSLARPLFPNIRKLHFYIANWTLPLIHHVVSPKLNWLHIDFAIWDASSCQCFVESLGPSCPDIKTIQIFACPSTLEKPMNQNIRCWTRLDVLKCSQINLDIDTLLHLTRISGLTGLSFMLSPPLINQITASPSHLVFSALRTLRISTTSTIPISTLFAYMRLPVIENVSICYCDISPGRHVIGPFLTALHTACTNQGTMGLTIVVLAPLDAEIQSAEHFILLPQDIHHFTGLNLACVTIDLDWTIDLKDGDLLEIASMFPRLTTLDINKSHGWRTPRITPAGLAKFLRKCPLLYQFCIAIDTLGYVSPQTSGDNPLRGLTSVNLADSVIEPESIPALATFFAHLFPQLADDTFHFMTWRGFKLRRRVRGWEIYMKRWEEVYELARTSVTGARPATSRSHELLNL